MINDNKDLCSEILITVSKTDDFNTIRELLDSSKIDYIFKSQLKPEACTGNNFFSVNRTTFFIKPEDFVEAAEICNGVVHKVHHKEKAVLGSGKSFLDRLINTFRYNK